MTQQGEPSALSLINTVADLSRAGNAMLSSRLLTSAVTRRWLYHSVDTSNLRNGVGRPCEIYREGSSAISTVDAYPVIYITRHSTIDRAMH